MEETERELLSAISTKLDRLIAVLVTQGRAQDEQIRVLRNLGYDWKFIGATTGLNADAARQRYSRARGGEA